MPVFRIDIAAGTEFQPLVKELVLATIHQFSAVRNINAGVANGSCGAAIKLMDGRFGFGHSRAYLLDNDAIGDPGAFNPENHAERVAIRQIVGLAYHPHLFVELAPCHRQNGTGCDNWCELNIPNINVWWMYPTTATMINTHRFGYAQEINYLNALLP